MNGTSDTALLHLNREQPSAVQQRAPAALKPRFYERVRATTTMTTLPRNRTSRIRPSALRSSSTTRAANALARWKQRNETITYVSAKDIQYGQTSTHTCDEKWNGNFAGRIIGVHTSSRKAAQQSRRRRWLLFRT